MPKKSSTSPMKNKVLKGVDEHKHDAVVQDSGGDLPSGLEGIAELTDMYVGFYERGDHQGEPYFMAAGIVQEPESFNNVKVSGRRTQIGPEAICDTPERQGDKARKTEDDHVDWILNQMKLFDEDAVHELPSPCTLEDLDTLARAIAEAGPYFSFRTWGGDEYKGRDGKMRKGRINHVWSGIVNYEGNGEATEEVVEEEAAQEEVEEETYEEETGEDAEETYEEEEGAEEEAAEEEPSEDEEPDIDALVEAADAEDGDAQNTLLDMAADASGMPRDKVEGLPTWQEVAELITGGGEEEEEEEEEEAGWTPTEGDAVMYKPPKAKVPSEYTVFKVFPKNQTVKLRNEKTNRMLANPVAWDKLDPA